MTTRALSVHILPDTGILSQKESGSTTPQSLKDWALEHQATTEGQTATTQAPSCTTAQGAIIDECVPRGGCDKYHLIHRI